MIVIGFGHKARQGKDTAAEFATEMFNVPSIAPVFTARQLRFADALYQECREIYGMTEKDAPLLQRHGQLRRLENENYWLDKVFDQIDLGVPGFAFISDVRYRNEAERIKSVGGFTVDVRRLNEDGTLFIDQSRPADHPSEIDLDGYNFDYYITAKSGQSMLVKWQTLQIVSYIESYVIDEAKRSAGRTRIGGA